MSNNDEDVTGKRPRTAYKALYEKANIRYQSMKATAAVGYILALLEVFVIALLIWK